MERLTARDEYGSAYYPHCFREPCNGTAEPDDCATCDFNYQVCDRLAELEDKEERERQRKTSDEPMKVTHEATLQKCCTCPRCKNVVDEFVTSGDQKFRVRVEFCKFCGAHLDWSGEQNYQERGDKINYEEKIIWHEVVTRPMTQEEQEEFARLGEECTYVFDCDMPDDGEEILVATKWGVSADICGIDDGFYLENCGDWDGVIAWAELPKYRKENGK